MSTKIFKYGGYAAASLVLFLFSFALLKYPGRGAVYLIFSMVFNGLLLAGLRKNRLFFDTFIGLFLWLGFWLKFSVRMAFMGGRFHESIGPNFDYSGAAYDHVLLVSACGAAALLLASYLRSRYFFKYPDKDCGVAATGLMTFYDKHRKGVWCVFCLFFIAVAVTNAWLGIYQRGSIPRTQLPYKLGGVMTWLLFFGLASISAAMLEFEIALKKKIACTVVILGILETFFSNVSMLSRGMVLNFTALAIGTFKRLQINSIKLSVRFYLTATVLFILLFGLSIFAVTQLRAHYYSGQSMGAGIALARTSHNTKILMLDRWVGIESAIAVSTYPGLGWDLWKRAWQEKFTHGGTSFFDLKIAASQYRNLDASKYHFISLPGILAFCFYPGSYVFLFAALLLIGGLAAVFEVVVFKISCSNMILSALLAQVVAYRLVHFGYVPGRSYMLFGSLCLTVLIYYILNKILAFWYRDGAKT